jgi:RsiW-degrading membrane proteinase PrsW (M82 family)
MNVTPEEVAPPAVAETPAATAPGLRLHLLALGLALLGGVFGILGALVQELQVLGGGLLGVFIGAPIIEEALKPAGIYLLLLRWPQALAGRWHIAALTGLSGLCFGLIESLIYVEVYNPDGGSDFVLFRFTVTPLLHTLASTLVGLGLSRAVIDWAAGRTRLPRSTRNFYFAGAGLHALYNTTAVILVLAGVIEFD